MIEEYGFGSIRINGIYYHRDLKIINGRVVPDWWRGKGHVCSLEDIEDLLAASPEIIVLGKGKPGLMRSDERLRRILGEQGIRLIEQPTAEAVQTFNNLHRAHRVGAAFHLTC